MDNSANKALTIGVAVFITIMITSAILFILGRMQEVYSRVYETDISIQNQFDEYDAFDSTTKTGIEVYNAVKKYVGNQFVTITFKGNLILEKGEFNSSKMNDDELKRRIEQYNVKTNFIKVENGITRINVKISSNEETALNGCGPQITEDDLEKILKQIDEIQKEDIVILAGNIPKNINKNIYEKICLKLKEKETTFIVDATRELLIGILKYNPFFIKPNKEELEETFGVKIQGEQEIIQYAKKLQEMGARNVLISLGGEGAILITEENKIYKANAPKGKVISTVGSGDSMVAGFIAGYIKDKDYKEALKLGIAAGSASAFSTELATKERVEKLLK